MNQNFNPTMVDRIIEELVETWILYVFYLNNNSLREDFKTETIQKLENLIQILNEIDFERISLNEWEDLETIQEEKSNN